MNLVYGLAPYEFSVAQVAMIECPPWVWEVVGSNPVGGSDFFSLSHARDMLIISFSQNLFYLYISKMWSSQRLCYN